jgi:tryptophan synthase alpha subunit
MKSAGADAVIVGSAIVNLISSTKGGRDKMLKKIKDYTRTMKAACKEWNKTH